MFAYWLLFSLFALAALTERSRDPGSFRSDPRLILLAIFMTLMIGLRFEVGADWLSYIRIFDRATDVSLGQAMGFGDPAYELINWSVNHLGGTVWQVNLVCGAIFSWGLMRFCRSEPNPLMAALVAIPYLVVVVAMGYTRQAVAIGIVLAGIGSLNRGGSIARFVVYVAVAALFHRTAVIVLPLAVFAGRGNRLVNILAILVGMVGLYSALLDESVDKLVRNYIEAQYSSQGAAIRVAMNIPPALLIIFASRRLGIDDYQRRFWLIVAVAAIACVPALFLSPSTTAVDRVALYLIPIQMVAIGRALSLFRSPLVGRLAIVTYSSAVLFVWLNFAAHSIAWIPYRIALDL